MAAIRETDRERNPTRTREAILDAAERLFAREGYAATSLYEVGAAAGVSRGTPGYFFGSKEALYRAVLERCLDRVRRAVRSGRERALASHERPEVILAGAVGEYFDFILANPTFVRLLEWEALSGGKHLRDVPPHIEVAQEALGALIAELDLPEDRQAEAAQLLLSVIGLCWFPAVHAHTLLPALGIDPADAVFREDRRRHVVRLVVHALSHALSATPSTTASGIPADTRIG